MEAVGTSASIADAVPTNGQETQNKSALQQLNEAAQAEITAREQQCEAALRAVLEKYKCVLNVIETKSLTYGGSSISVAAVAVEKVQRR